MKAAHPTRKCQSNWPSWPNQLKRLDQLKPLVDQLVDQLTRLVDQLVDQLKRLVDQVVDQLKQMVDQMEPLGRLEA